MFFPGVCRQVVERQFADCVELSFLSYGCSHNAGGSHLQMVKEKLVCHAIIGAQRERSLVMTVDVICEFIAPLIQLSTKKLVYRLEKVSGQCRGGLGAPTGVSEVTCSLEKLG